MSKQIQFKYILGLDCETSGIVKKSKNPCKSDDGKTTAQAVSWGFVILDSQTLDQVDELYVEIKWNGESKWDKGAENIHGLSKEYLEQNGLTEEEAVIKIMNWLFPYFGNDAVVPLGHNVQFDINFFYGLVEKFDLPFKFANRTIDTMGFALILAKSFNSDQLFETVGLDQRTDHNALEDIQMTVESLRRLKAVFNYGLEQL